MNKIASVVVPAGAGCLFDGDGVLVTRTNPAPSVMTVTPYFYQSVRWPLLLQRCVSVAGELSGAIRNFTANISLVKRLNAIFLICDITLLVGDRGSTVVKALCYKSEGSWFDSKWCHWYFSLL